MTKDILEKFRDVNTADFPDFHNFNKPLEMGLWVLWVGKEELNIRRLTAVEIVNILVRVMEVSVSIRAIVNAFNRAGGKIHIYEDGDETSYDIMKAGKDHLVASVGSGSLQVYYFVPGKKHSSKRILVENILDELKGELKIVDPYCDSGTLDILSKSRKRKVRCLTRIDNLQPKMGQQFLRDLKDFKSEYPDVEFKSYSHSDIHDRYIISQDRFIILGYSLKDLGAKESFAIELDKTMCNNIFDVLVENFNRRWKIANPL